MTRRSLFKSLLAAPLAALCFWRKKPPEFVEYTEVLKAGPGTPYAVLPITDDISDLICQIQRDIACYSWSDMANEWELFSGNHDMIRGIPPKP